jgi:long-subunit fatty acid transport protein
MKHKLLTACLIAGLLTSAPASANPEATAYDGRSIGMALTGTSFLERPAALTLNPANMEGIKKLAFTLQFTNLGVRQTAPVMGPNTKVKSGLGYGPLPSGFIGGRIAPNVVFTGGVYIETGYGSSYDQVTCLDGDPVAADGTPADSTTPCTNLEPQDLTVTFFVGEFAVGTSFRIHEKFWLGVALRVPFSKQVASLWQNVGAALGGFGYARVKNNLGGIGFPSPRFGITIKPHRKVSIGVMYRMYAKIKLTGTTETSLSTDSSTGEPIELTAAADWFIPHAIAFGVSYQANSHVLLAFEGRFQFHGADKTGNRNQTVTATDPSGSLPETVIVVPFGWKTVWSARAALEYRFNQLIAIRTGAGIAAPATSAPWAQYFTPPPGLSGHMSLGLGFYWPDRNNRDIKDKYMLDLAGLFAFTRDNIDDSYIGEDLLIPGTDPSDPDNFVEVCSREQVVRTGCPGDYKVFSYWASLSFSLQY